jgi:predicted DNA-binding transcriptional regulator YafY
MIVWFNNDPLAFKIVTSALLLTVPASHEQEIMMEIRKHGSPVKVLKPAWLREKVVQEIKEAVLKSEE